jgi:hypothetical protein
LVLATRRQSTSVVYFRTLVNTELCVSLRREIGAHGYALLMQRVLLAACAEMPALCGTMVSAEGRFEALDPLLRQDEASWREAATVVTTLLLEQLALFLGESLMRRIVREACPEGAAESPLPQETEPVRAGKAVA